MFRTNRFAFSPEDERAALPAITVLDDGTVVMSYETYGSDGKVHVHVAWTADHGLSVNDIEEYSFTPLPLNPGNYISTLKGSPSQFGDYDFLTSIGNVFYGTFAGMGDVNTGGIDTTGLIDPFFSLA